MLYKIKNISNDVIATVYVATIYGKYITLKTYIDIENYSNLLLNKDITKRKQIIKIFGGINHLKEVIYSNHINGVSVINNTQIIIDINNFLNIISDEFGLKVITEN